MLSASYHKSLLIWNKWMKKEYVKSTFKFYKFKWHPQRSRTVRRRNVSAMVVANVLCEKIVCVLKYFEVWATKDVCFISVFVVILMARGQCSFSSVRILEELGATVTTCVKKYGLWFKLAWGVCEFTQKLSLDSIHCLIFHVGIILIAFHS